MKKDAFGVLIVHGFTATLNSVNSLVEPLEKLGLHVSVPILKGHGESSPEKLRGVTWRDWMQDAEAAFHELSEKVDKIFVIGHSMGALIALNLATKYQGGQLDSVILAAPAFRLVSMLGPGRPLHFLAPVLKTFIKSWDLSVALSDHDEKSRSMHYLWAPTDAIMSFFDLISFTESRLHDIRCPMLILHNRNDQTVTQNSSDIAFKGVATASSDKDIVWLERSEHQMFCDCEKMRAIDVIIDFIQSRISKTAG
ncbi:alpha/beta hydrolase [Prosthecochloris marina]|uniref:Alpha/beta hydrolase n=1 Tax=Prosthecochloris marina TaxID=2017681 RepID=A0A317T6Y5_9CHLB|nr:alpha/beta fold hydrolase [Prosthecochloris marina]PWW81226.1 alpha/beta hydrolase [Prosthecochloris marina]